MNDWQTRRVTVGIVALALGLPTFMIALVKAQQTNPGHLTGNWVVRSPNNDGTSRNTYLDLKEKDAHITGSIRVTQFYYLITESTGGPEGFTITGTMKDGKTDRKVQYEGKLVGDELHVSTRRRPTDNP